MAKTKTSKNKSQTKKDMANGNSKSQETPEQLYASALALVEQNQPEEALEQAQKLWTKVQNGSVTEALPAVNLLGEISIELGDVSSARAYFEQAVQLDPEGKVPEALGGGAEKFLWLAQLCEDGGKTSVTWFERGISALQHEIGELEGGQVSGYDDETLLLMRVEKKRKLANALCGIVEVYMTDLSWDDDAEARCENLVTQAMAVEDETSPEVLQTLASVRLSQERKEDARAALERSIATWKDLEPEDPSVPDFATRISLARLLMEAELDGKAMFVLQRLIQEDDQSVEAWYLGGWCQHLMAERSRSQGSSDEQPNKEQNTEMNLDQDELKETTLKGSRHWLNKALKLYKLLDYEDERLFEHTKELVAGLDAVLEPAEDDDADAAEGAYEEWDGIEDDDADEGDEDEDEEMQDS